MLRKLTDKEYKNIKEILPSLQFAINTTYQSAIECTPFEAGHGLKARTVTDARLQRPQPQGAKDQVDGDLLEDIDSQFEQSLYHNTLELATRMKDTAQAVSEWHRKMTNQKLNQKGNRIDLDKFTIGSRAYFYKPPTQGEVERTGRKVKHLDHYTGPGVITEKIGSKSFVISYEGRTFQRDAGMILPEKEYNDDHGQINCEDDHVHPLPETGLHQQGTGPVESEYIIIKDEINAPDWYCAQVLQVLADRIKVAWLTTKVGPLENYSKASRKARKSCLKDAVFARTWILHTGMPTSDLAQGSAKNSVLWTGKLPLAEWDDLVLVRNIGLSSEGILDSSSLKLAASLELPHHEGAGGVEDFVSTEEYKKHIKKNEKWSSKKSKKSKLKSI